jgi:hypothetical protein
MKNSVLKSIINNTFIPSYDNIINYFSENNLKYNGECKIDGGFILNFCPSDSKQLFEKNLTIKPQNWYYRTHPVKYTLNSLGYRTEEFDNIDWKESIVIFGCSFTFGIGVTDEHTISYFLEQLSGRPVINMGIGASSIQTALHNSIILNDSKYPTPKSVVYLWTGLDRCHLYENNYVNHFGAWSLKNDFTAKQNIVPFNLMNIKIIRNLWKNKTIYYEGSNFGQEKLINALDSENHCEFLPGDKFARDLMHCGPVSNRNIAEKIYKKIKPQLDT